VPKVGGAAAPSAPPVPTPMAVLNILFVFSRLGGLIQIFVFV